MIDPSTLEELLNRLLSSMAYLQASCQLTYSFKGIGNVDYDFGTPFGSTRMGVGAPFTVISSVSVKF
jgi:hypothetical protein